MTTDPADPAEPSTVADLPPGANPEIELTPAARRALEEAATRRAAAETAARAKEINGPKGEEPTRYGDWERRGIAYDF